MFFLLRARAEIMEIMGWKAHGKMMETNAEPNSTFDDGCRGGTNRGNQGEV
jgi:hypothetical protein